MDPKLRAHLPALADPADDKPRTLETFGLRQHGRILAEQARTDSAVKSLDDCNRENGEVARKVAAAVTPRKAWWRFW